MKERTLSIIKPDGVKKNLIGRILMRFEEAGLKIVGCRMIHLSQAQAEQFYDIHKERPFFKDLVAFMTEGPVLVSCLEGENAIQKNRDIMGATDPKKALAANPNYGPAYYDLALLNLDADPFPSGGGKLDNLQRLNAAKGFLDQYKNMPGVDMKLYDTREKEVTKAITREEKKRKKAGKGSP